MARLCAFLSFLLNFLCIPMEGLCSGLSHPPTLGMDSCGFGNSFPSPRFQKSRIHHGRHESRVIRVVTRIVVLGFGTHGRNTRCTPYVRNSFLGNVLLLQKGASMTH